MNRWGCSLICWHVHTSSSYLHSATEVRMPKQSDSVEGRELWPLDTNLLKTPVAGREWVWKRFLWIPGILLVHSTWSHPPKRTPQKAGTRARQGIWLIRLLSDVPKASVCSCISISSSSWLFGPWPLAWLGCFWPCQWMMPYWFLSQKIVQACPTPTPPLDDHAAFWTVDRSFCTSGETPMTIDQCFLFYFLICFSFTYHGKVSLRFFVSQ